MAIVSRGFGGKPRTPDEFADRLPPGQYYERGFPVLTAGPTPDVSTDGDVRHGSTKRVGAAVGEGAMAAALVHRRLEELERDQG